MKKLIPTIFTVSLFFLFSYNATKNSENKRFIRDYYNLDLMGRIKEVSCLDTTCSPDCIRTLQNTTSYDGKGYLKRYTSNDFEYNEIQDFTYDRNQNNTIFTEVSVDKEKAFPKGKNPFFAFNDKGQMVSYLDSLEYGTFKASAKYNDKNQVIKLSESDIALSDTFLFTHTKYTYNSKGLILNEIITNEKKEVTTYLYLYDGYKVTEKQKLTSSGEYKTQATYSNHDHNNNWLYSVCNYDNGNIIKTTRTITYH